MRAALRLREQAMALRGGLRGGDPQDVSDGLPLPPARLRALVSGTSDVPWFLESGRRSASMVVDLLARNGFAIEDTDRLLDLGCGCGRVTRHWAGLPGTEVFGCDFNAELVEWCRKHLPFGCFERNELMPPLPYPDERFDLITLHSVFTHLTVPAQRAWMPELLRVMRPGGLLVLTTHGDSFLDKLRPAERSRYERGEPVVQFGDVPGSNLCAAYHPPGWIEHELCQGLEPHDFEGVGGELDFMQDVYLLRKPGGSFRAHEPEGAGRSVPG
jgi:SAM-dependent methyltransferase